ncbi:unnamed protein product [Camellia sinensis]
MRVRSLSGWMDGNTSSFCDACHDQQSLSIIDILAVSAELP